MLAGFIEAPIPFKELGVKGGWLAVFAWGGVLGAAGFLVHALRLYAMTDPAKRLAKGYFGSALGPAPIVLLTFVQIYSH